MKKGEKVDVSSCSQDRLIASASMHRLPSLVRISDYSSTARSVLNISTKDFRNVDYPDFKDAFWHYSKGGWFLMQHIGPDVCRCVGLYLLNPSTGVRLDLPTLDCTAGVFTFSIDSGIPDCVVHADIYGKDSRSISIQMIHPGDEVWEVHEFKELDNNIYIKSVALVGKLVLCFDDRKAIVSFDLSSRHWAVACNRKWGLRDGLTYFAESESGETARVFCHNPLFSSFNFDRLDLRTLDWPWVEMNGLEVDNTGWFLGKNSFFTRGEGQKVHTLVPNVYGGPNQPNLEMAKRVIYRRQPDGTLDTSFYYRNIYPIKFNGMFNVYAHNVEDGSTESLLPESFDAKACCWVHPDLL